MTKASYGTRREMCYLVGKRAMYLGEHQSALAWNFLAQELRTLEEKDIPKFEDLIGAIRRATIKARQH